MFKVANRAKTFYANLHIAGCYEDAVKEARVLGVGAESLQHVADYYGKHRNTLYALYSRSEIGVNSLVFGYVYRNWIEAQLKRGE